MSVNLKFLLGQEGEAMPMGFPLPDRVAVLGLGVSGCAVAESLLRYGIEVIAADEKPLETLALRGQAEKLREEGVTLFLGADAFERVYRARPTLIVLSPGIPLSHPSLQRLKEGGTEIWGELELAYRILQFFRPDLPIIAVTGTKGKTTTAHLITAMLKASGFPVLLGGNVGTPFIRLVDELGQGKQASHLVLEVSSFQLMTCHEFRPAIGVLTNLSLDHLDWHKDADEYRRSKAKLFSRQRGDDWAVLNADDPGARWMAGYVRGRILWCGQALLNSCPFCTHWVSTDERFIWAALGQERFPVLRSDTLLLPGEHNRQNLMVAVGAALLVGAKGERIQEAVKEFRGIPHRLEIIAEIEGVKFVNDSAATTPIAVGAALKTFDAPIILIAGGRDKGGNWGTISEIFRAKVKALIAIGEAKETIKKVGRQGGVKVIREAVSIDEAVTEAMAIACPGDVVLLSPGCASHDMFTSYQERGDAFRVSVSALRDRRGRVRGISL